MKVINKIFFLFIFILQFLKTIKSSELSEIGSHLILKLRKNKKNEIKGLQDENYVKEIMYNEFYSKFNIGIPLQRLIFYYELNSYESSISEYYYDKISSTTYKLINESENLTENNRKGFLSQESFEIDQDIILQNFTFFLKEKSENFQNVNKFGLNKMNKKESNLSFLNQLKKNNFIDKNIFSFLFEDSIITESRSFDAQILIGVMPHDINPTYEERDLKWALNDKNKNWYLNFDKINYKNIEIKDKIVNLDLDLNLIIGPESFRKILLEEFFKKNLEDNHCKESYFFNIKDEQFYIFYSCNSETQFIEIPKIYFYHKEFNETFELSFENLFNKYKNRFFFKIIFKKNPQNFWTFGQMFLSNYRLVFDLELERIGYYKTYPHKDRPILAFLSIGLFLLIVLIGYLYVLFNNPINNEVNEKEIIYPIRKEYEENTTSNYEKNTEKQKNKEVSNKKEKQN